MSSVCCLHLTQSLSEAEAPLPPPKVEPGLVGEPRVASLNGRMRAVNTRTFLERASDFCQALWNSRIIRHLLVAAGVALAIAYFASPPGWFTLGIGAFAGLVGALTWMTTMAVQYAVDKHTDAETLAFELSAIFRFFKTDADEIIPGLFLGAFPNRAALPLTTSDWDQLVQKGVGAVLSINADWERVPRGLSFPYDMRDCEENNIAYLPITSADHVPLTSDNMHTAADFIHEQLEAGKKVYVHCRAGKGRSAMGVAAYLMKYKNYTVQEAQDPIKARRPKSTILKKTNALKKFTWIGSETTDICLS